jgi:hypothetical protein
MQVIIIEDEKPAAEKLKKALLKGKLLLDLSPKPGEEILVSQERAAAFKIWMGN